MPVLLVIDDEPFIRDTFRYLFRPPAVTLVTAGSAAEGVRLFAEQRPEVAIVDIQLPDDSGLNVVQKLHQIDPKALLILMTGDATAANAIEAMRLGAYDYLVKPLDLDRLTELVRQAFQLSRLMRVPAEIEGARDQPIADDGTADLMVGRCPAMQEVYKFIGRMAPQNVTVLIRGESGTGKELAARAIYHHSKRAGGPFLAINCAAIPETLLESELFGHEKGAFTGAERRRLGKFEQCHGGTLFLDEIGDMSPATQSKVLRVLQDQRFERVGGNETIQTDVRLIAATNRDLERLMAEEKFRPDLYYRLNVCTLVLPPLRERMADLRPLAEHFLRRFGRELGKPMTSIATETLERLSAYPWPGNIRELQSVLKQAILRATGPVLAPEFLPAPFQARAAVVPTAATTLDVELAALVRRRLEESATDLHAEVLARVERWLFLEVLRHTRDNISEAARVLGISRTTLRARLAALGIAIERSTSVRESSPGNVAQP